MVYIDMIYIWERIVRDTEEKHAREEGNKSGAEGGW